MKFMTKDEIVDYLLWSQEMSPTVFSDIKIVGTNRIGYWRDFLNDHYPEVGEIYSTTFGSKDPKEGFCGMFLGVESCEDFQFGHQHQYVKVYFLWPEKDGLDGMPVDGWTLVNLLSDLVKLSSTQ